MRVLIVDDEPLARIHLARLCEGHADIRLIGEADSGAAAIAAIRDEGPDLVILDIELQDLTGFGVLESASAARAPLAIMVTAYPQYALKAFDAEVIDYLTKPVDARRFATAIERARQRHARTLVSRMFGEFASELRASLAPGRRTGEVPRHIVGERAQRLYFICVDEIDYIEVDGNYVTIHAGEDRYISRNTLKHLQESLAPLGFLRIERSLLVNLGRVEYVERLGEGAFAFTTRGGARLVSSAGYRASVMRSIRNGRLQHPPAATG